MLCPLTPETARQSYDRQHESAAHACDFRKLDRNPQNTSWICSYAITRSLSLVFRVTPCTVPPSHTRRVIPAERGVEGWTGMGPLMERFAGHLHITRPDLIDPAGSPRRLMAVPAAEVPADVAPGRSGERMTRGGDEKPRWRPVRRRRDNASEHADCQSRTC